MYKGLGDEYYNWGCDGIMNGDGLHRGPHGEILILERKNAVEEFKDRDLKQRHIFCQWLKHNPTMRIYYTVCSVHFVARLNDLVLQIEQVYQLLSDNSVSYIPVLNKYPGNAKDITKNFDNECKRLRNVANSNGHMVPDYGKRRIV